MLTRLSPSPAAQAAGNADAASNRAVYKAMLDETPEDQPDLQARKFDAATMAIGAGGPAKQAK
jgi:hypothetical protein